MITTKRERDFDGPLTYGEEKVALVREMFDTIAPRYDLLNKLMTFGLDRSWRARTVANLNLSRSSTVADLACGTGDLTLELSERGYRSFGIDFSANMVRRAAAHRCLVVQGDAAQLPIADGSVDGIVSGFALRNFADLDAVFGAMARALRPGGRLSLLEVDRPSGSFARLGHELWMGRVVPALGSLLSDASAYRYLPRSIAYLPDEQALIASIEGAGFEQVTKTSLSMGVVQILNATRSGASGLSPESTEATRRSLDD